MALSPSRDRIYQQQSFSSLGLLSCISLAGWTSKQKQRVFWSFFRLLRGEKEFQFILQKLVTYQSHTHGFTSSILPIISWSLSKTKAYASCNILYLYLVNISYVQYCGIHASILFSCQRQGSWIHNIVSECFSLPTAPPCYCTWTMNSHTWTINSQVFLAIEGLAAQEAVKLTYV